MFPVESNGLYQQATQFTSTLNEWKSSVIDIEAKHSLHTQEDRELFLRDGQIATMACRLEKIKEEVEMFVPEHNL